VSPVVQGKLLRILQEREFMWVGGTDTIKADIRIIAAMNKNLEKCIEEGIFREDLYYRLNVVSIRLPTLRERKVDIPLLAQFFLRKFSKRIGKNICEIPQDVLRDLIEYDWLGNIRELENVMQRTVVPATEGNIEISHLPHKLLKEHTDSGPFFQGLSYKEAKQRVLDSFSKEFVERLLQTSKGNISQAAKHARTDTANFRRLIRKYNIQVEDHKKTDTVRNDLLTTLYITGIYKVLLCLPGSLLTYINYPSYMQMTCAKSFILLHKRQFEQILRVIFFVHKFGIKVAIEIYTYKNTCFDFK
jgi:DNA-binding NtrC family response regulator